MTKSWAGRMERLEKTPWRRRGRSGTGPGRRRRPAVAAPAVHLVIGGAHGVEDVLGPGPESDESVDGELGHVLLALGPGPLHDLQCPGEAVRRDVGGGVQGPLEVRPGGARCRA